MAAPAPTPPKTYRDLYVTYDARPCIPVLDPYGGDSNASQTVLHAGLINSAYDEIAQVVVLLQDGLIRIVHRITMYRPPFGTTSQWDGRVFGFCDDIGPGGSITLVEAPGNLFRKAQATNVPTLDNVDAALQALAPTETYLAAIANGDANSETVTTRYSALAPFNYTGLILKHQGLPVRQFYAEVAPIIIASGDGPDCHIFLTFLRSCLTRADGGGAPPPSGVDDISIPFPDDALKKFTWNIVKQDLPALAAGNNTGDAAFAQQALDLGGQVAKALTDTQVSRQAALDRASAPKLLSVAHPHGCDAIMNLTHSSVESELPPFWQMLPTVKKNEVSALLTGSMDERRAQAGSTGVSVQATVSVVSDLANFQFTSMRPENLTESAFSLFKHISGSSTAARKSADQVRIFNLTQSGNAAPSWEVLETAFQSDEFQARSSLEALTHRKGYSTFLDVVLGTNHPLSQVYRNYVFDFERILPDLELYLRGMAAHGPTHDLVVILGRIMMYEHIKITTYVNSICTRRGVPLPPPPDFHEIINLIQMRTFLHQLPDLPVRSPLGGGPPLTPLPPAPPPTAPRGQTPRAPAGQTTQRVTNLRTNAALTDRFQRHGRRVPELVPLGGATPYADGHTSGRGNQLCLNYCLNGACNSTCGRSSSHRELSETETAVVGRFLTTAGVPA